ncbi:hypothetical protein CR513_34663, partial [Mucuna pruriens]
MDTLKRKNRKAYTYLAKWPKQSWTKAYFSDHPKVDNITNNNCEVYNAKILKLDKQKKERNKWTTIWSGDGDGNRYEEYLECTNFDKSLPPPIKKKHGRLKKARRKDGNEGQVINNRLKRSYPTPTCARCGFKGHNSKGCTDFRVLLKPKNWIPIEEPIATEDEMTKDEMTKDATTKVAIQDATPQVVVY